VLDEEDNCTIKLHLCTSTEQIACAFTVAFGEQLEHTYTMQGKSEEWWLDEQAIVYMRPHIIYHE